MAFGDDPTFGTSSKIGQYFGVVSTIPSLVLAFWVYALLVLQPWSAHLNVDALVSYDPIPDLGHLVALLVVALVLAVVSHPVQFLLVQMLEGYWGHSQPARALATQRTLVHLRARAGASRIRSEAHIAAKARTNEPARETRYLAGALFHDNPQVAEQVARGLIDLRTADMALANYPADVQHVLPTRLGNVLRRYEIGAGAPLGLDLIRWASHIGMAAEPSHTAYVQDQRQALDLAARMTAVGLLCTVLTVGALWPHGPWLLLALVPLGAAWLSYRGAIAAAHSYGQAITAWLHLNRFALYDRLSVPRPNDSEGERELGARLKLLVDGDKRFDQTYSAPVQNSTSQSTALRP